MGTLAVWQGLQNDSISGFNTRLLMFFVGLVAISMVTQAIVVIFLALQARKAQVRVLAIAEELRARAKPIIDRADELVKETLPKLKIITDNLVETSNVVKTKAHEFETTLGDVNTKTKAQVTRVDGMVTTALTATGTIAEMIHQGIRVPVVEVLGVVNGFKAGIDVLLSKSKGFANAASTRKKTAITVYNDREGM